MFSLKSQSGKWEVCGLSTPFQPTLSCFVLKNWEMIYKLSSSAFAWNICRSAKSGPLR